VSKRVLVAAGSKHGATAEIAMRIGEVLVRSGISVVVADPRDVRDLEGLDAVVLGSAVYAGHWISEAIELAEKIAAADPRPPTWLFSSGPIGDPPKPEEDPVDVADVSAKTSAIDHRVFSGKLDKAKLGFGERAITMALRAPEGDFRDWVEIETWADEIANTVIGAA